MNRFVKHKFYNPLRQIYSHIIAVESYLQIENNQILPIIVFSNRSKLSKINVGEHDKVFQFKDALRFVSKVEKKGNIVFTKEAVVLQLERLIEKSNMPDEVKQKHIEEVKTLAIK
jgi:hypothetical protein